METNVRLERKLQQEGETLVTSYNEDPESFIRKIKAEDPTALIEKAIRFSAASQRWYSYNPHLTFGAGVLRDLCVTLAAAKLSGVLVPVIRQEESPSVEQKSATSEIA